MPLNATLNAAQAARTAEAIRKRQAAAQDEASGMTAINARIADLEEDKKAGKGWTQEKQSKYEKLLENREKMRTILSSGGDE